MKLIAVVLALMNLPATAAEPRRMSWTDLSTITGKNVRIAMPDGAVISGKAVGVDPDALVVQVRDTSNPGLYPKGECKVPRASLRAFEIRRKTAHFRIIGTTLGTVAGFAGGAVAGWSIAGGLWGRGNDGAGAAAFVGIWAGGTVGGYLIGNAGDKKTTTIVVE